MKYTNLDIKNSVWLCWCVLRRVLFSQNNLQPEKNEQPKNKKGGRDEGPSHSRNKRMWSVAVDLLVLWLLPLLSLWLMLFVLSVSRFQGKFVWCFGGNCFVLLEVVVAYISMLDLCLLLLSCACHVSHIGRSLSSYRSFQNDCLIYWKQIYFARDCITQPEINSQCFR